MKKAMDTWIGAIGSTLLGTTTDGLHSLSDLSKIKRQDMEVERKYLLGKPGESIALIETAFINKITGFITTSGYPLVSKVTFSGVDQYFRARTSSRRFDVRYRIGMNRGPELTLKFKIDRSSTDVRGEVNLKVGNTRPESVQQFISALVGPLDPKALVFPLKCIGNIWVIKDKSGDEVEFVIYTYEILGRSETAHVFLEIEALENDNVETALRQIKRFERMLGIEKLRCNKSVADIFGVLAKRAR